MADVRLRLLLVAGERAGGIGRHVELIAERLPAHGVDVEVVGATRPNVRSQLDNVDVVHAHGLRAGAIAASALKGTAPALVVTWHNAPLGSTAHRIAHRLVSSYAARRADLTLGASPDLTAAARRAGARDARDTFVVAPPLPPPTRSRAAVRDELGVGDRPLLLAVGRLQAQKRLDVLVAAAARWASAGPIVAIAGSGPDEAALRRQVDSAGAAVRFLGARDDIADLLAAADVVALPSQWEARSLVAQEALRAGVPLVTTPVGGLPDLVGDAAIMVPVGEPTALADAVERLVADAGLRERFSEAGRARAATWPSVETAMAELVAIYADLASLRGAS